EVAEIIAGGDKPKIFSENKSDLNNIPVFANAEKKCGLMGYTDNPRIVESAVTVAARGSNVGFVAVRKEPFFPVVRLLTLIPNKERLDVDYLFYNLKQNRPNGTGSGQPQITIPDISKRSISLPSLLNQQKTAKILSSLDAKIELNHKINAELEAMAKLIYDYWFVQFDFPNAEGKPYKASGGKMVYNEVLKREIPEGWGGGAIKNLFCINPSLKLQIGTDASYIDMGSLPNNGFITEIPLSKEFNGGMKFQNGDVLIARITPCLENGKTGLVTFLKSDEVGFGSTEFIVLRGKEMPLSCFGANLARSDVFRKYAIQNMIGTSGRKRVDAKSIEVFKLPIPPKSLLERFERIVHPYFEIETNNSLQNQKLAELRDWLLPMLMNGQVTVKEAEEVVSGERSI
ncbi:MAG: restriction endonuclease subunit S, partial [Bacteroidia bacterium]|nr:restriction endonuclease subunit S [Bacteroidia bacterium]